MKRADIFDKLRVLSQLRHDRVDLLANRQGMELNFENVVQIADLGANTSQNVLVKSFLQKSRATGMLRKSEQR
jgi:hypothetical protein